MAENNEGQKMRKDMTDRKTQENKLNPRDWEALEELGETLKKQLTVAQQHIVTSVSTTLANIDLSKEMSDWKTLEDLGESLRENVIQAQNVILTSVDAAIAKSHRSKGDALEQLGDSLREQVTHAQESIRNSVSTALANLRDDDLFDGLFDKKTEGTALEEVVLVLKEDRARNIEKEMSDRRALEELGETFNECCDLAQETIMTSVSLALAQLDMDKINKDMRDWRTLEQLGYSLKERVLEAQNTILDSVSSALATIHQEAMEGQMAETEEEGGRRRGKYEQGREERHRSAGMDKGRKGGKNKENETEAVNKEGEIGGVKRQRTKQWKAREQFRSEKAGASGVSPQNDKLSEDPALEKIASAKELADDAAKTVFQKNVQDTHVSADQIKELASEAVRAAFKKDVEKAARQDEAAIDAVRKDVLKAALEEGI